MPPPDHPLGVWDREGKGTKVPISFFRVEIKNSTCEGVYCEPCLVVANAVAAQKKRMKADGVQ